MIIYTAKLHKKRILFGIVALVLVCGILAAYAGTHSRWGSVSAMASTEKVRTNEDRIAYLNELGLSVTPTAVAVEELTIPKDFSDLADYLALQSAQGFHLEDCAGKKVKRYTYGVENYPTGEENVMASILVYKKKVVGGEIFSAETGEILHGLEIPGTRATQD